MKNSFSKLFLAPLMVLAVASFAIAPVAEAAAAVEVAAAAAAAGRVPVVAAAAAAIAPAVAADGRTFRPTTTGPIRAPTMSAAPASTT